MRSAVDAGGFETKDMLVVVSLETVLERLVKRACQTNMSHSRDSAETWVSSGSRRVEEICSQEQRWIDVKCRNDGRRAAVRGGLPIMHLLLSAGSTSKTGNLGGLAPSPPMASLIALRAGSVTSWSCLSASSLQLSQWPAHSSALIGCPK